MSTEQTIVTDTCNSCGQAKHMHDIETRACPGTTTGSTYEPREWRVQHRAPTEAELAAQDTTAEFLNPDLCTHGEQASDCKERCACGDLCCEHAPHGPCVHVIEVRPNVQAHCKCEGFTSPVNFAAVGRSSDEIVLLAQLPKRMTKGQAVVLAAWLVAVAADHDRVFGNALKQIRAGAV